jgi:hypothetical protein
MSEKLRCLLRAADIIASGLVFFMLVHSHLVLHDVAMVLVGVVPLDELLVNLREETDQLGMAVTSEESREGECVSE